MELSRRESAGGEMVLAQGRRQVSGEQALLRQLAFSHKAVYKQQKP